MSPDNRTILFYDGSCALCNKAVNFVLKHETNKLLFFSSLDSNLAKEMLSPSVLAASDTLVLFEDGKVYTLSKASIKLAKFLKFPFSLARVLIYCPAFLRDSVYRFVSKNRYKWFGKMDVCRLPDVDTKKRFLD